MRLPKQPPHCWKGLVDFFPEPKGRLIGKAATKYQQVQTKALAMIEAQDRLARLWSNKY
jgi:hypothetical protein